jgi:hypothetical protein
VTELREQIYGIVSDIEGLADAYYAQAPQDNDTSTVTSYPYLVFSFLSSPKDRDTGTQWRIAKVQFDLYGQSVSALEAIVELVDAELRDLDNYSFTEFSAIMDIFEDFRTGAMSVESDDNKPLWQITMQYTIKLEE